QHRHAEAGGDHMANGFERTALQRALQAAGVTALRAGFEYLVTETVAGAEQQQLLVGEHVGVDFLASGPRVTAWHQHAERLVVEWLGDYAGFVDRQREDDDVELALLELIKQGGSEILPDHQRHAWRMAAHQRNQAWQQVGADGV